MATFSSSWHRCEVLDVCDGTRVPGPVLVRHGALARWHATGSPSSAGCDPTLDQIIHEQSEEQLSRLDKLVASLNETQTAFKHDRRGLAQLFAGLQQFMEDALGINVRGVPQAGGWCFQGIACSSWTQGSTCPQLGGLPCLPTGSLLPPSPQSMYKSQPKLPASLFHDTSPSGPLHTIASVCADAMRVRGMKRIDWASPALRKEVRGGPSSWICGWDQDCAV